MSCAFVPPLLFLFTRLVDLDLDLDLDLALAGLGERPPLDWLLVTGDWARVAAATGIIKQLIVK